MEGPFPRLPALTRVWPQLDALDDGARRDLRHAHRQWQMGTHDHHEMWIRHLLGELLGWGDAFCDNPALLDRLALDVPDHQATVAPSFALLHPDASGSGNTDPPSVALLGLFCPPETVPTARQPGSPWPASPADRLARLCRHHDVPLGVVAAGRWWTLVWAPREAATTRVTFDTADWTSAADRHVVRAFVSLLCRRRFFSVPDDETLAALLNDVEGTGEETTESLGRQVRQAVELLVAAIGRTDEDARLAGHPGLRAVRADEVYKAALATQMRILFAFFAEEKGLLPADNPLYAASYSAGRLCASLEAQARDTSEEDLEQSTAAWHRLVALFHAVYQGVDHPGLRICGYDGSLFDPGRHPWLEPGEGRPPWPVDDRTVLHMLRAVQYVTTGRGRARERRRTSFADLSVSDIGHVYEGLLEYDGQRAPVTVVGLIGASGREAGVELPELERLAVEAARDAAPVDALAAALSRTHKSSGIGTPKAVSRALRPLRDAERAVARRKLLAAAGGDTALAERLLPFYGLLRHDLRDLPVVILAGGLYVGRSSKRKATGAHYTPSWLAEQVAQGALEPLVHSPGPLETADRDAWVLKPSSEILKLKVADIACGSGAFLVAACRYLAERLVEARALEREAAAEGRIREQFEEEVIRPHEPFRERVGSDWDLVMIRARREIAERCLYGVDINPLAVELAKFALWLDTVEPGMPFTFLDDRLIDGDALVGVSSPEQLEAMHLLPERRFVHDRSPVDFTATLPQLTGLGGDTRRAAEVRAGIVDLPGTSLAALQAKRRVLREADNAVELQELLGDVLATASLEHARRGPEGYDTAAVASADHVRRISEATTPQRTAELRRDAREAARRSARSALGQDSGQFKPVNWPYRFPEVWQQGGFDAVIGNPPFLGGQKLTGILGETYRENLIHSVGRGTRGSADLVAYFLLRAHEILNERGQTGLIATNTLAQGDTREVGLDQLVADGVQIRQSVKSAPWPSRSAVLEYCAVWTSRVKVREQGILIADGVYVRGISSSLDPISQEARKPHRLERNQGIAFQGSIILGMGFTMPPEEAQAWRARSQENSEVLFPYLNGQDVNSRPDSSASRWVINFHDWSDTRAKRFHGLFDRVRRLVKPERSQKKRKVYRTYWWLYAEKRPAMRRAITDLDRAIVLTLVSKVVMPVMVSTGQVFAHKLAVFATDDFAMLALLSSSPHYWWSVSRSSTMKADLNYSPSDVFETFARPSLTLALRQLGELLDRRRREIMLERDSGLTRTYNLVHNQACTDADIGELRAMHRIIDEEVARAYGWDDLLAQPGGLDHGFHETRQGPRYTVGPVVRQEILDRLLELNQRRHAAEVAARPAGPEPLPVAPPDQNSATRTPPADRPVSTPSPRRRTSVPGSGRVR